MASFISTYEKGVDPKGRVSVPAAFRKELDTTAKGSLVAYPSVDDMPVRLICLPRADIDLVISRHRERSLERGEFSQILAGSSHDRNIERIMRRSHEMTFDKEGRIVLSSRLCERAGITDAAVFVGVGDHFEIRSPQNDAEYERVADEAEALRTVIHRGEPQ